MGRTVNKKSALMRGALVKRQVFATSLDYEECIKYSEVASLKVSLPFQKFVVQYITIAHPNFTICFIYFN